MTKAIKQFRLRCAQAIIRNIGYLEDQHGAELCEQYALRIYANWLATKCGFSVNPPDIRSVRNSFMTSLEDGIWPVDNYPLQSSLSAELDLLIREECFAWLEQSQLAALPSMLGEIYQQSLRSPLRINDDGRAEIKTNTARSTSAEFYTPPWVVTYCFRQIERCGDYSDLTIFDPSCGAGNFLLGAIETAKAAACDVIAFAKKLAGADIDARAVSLCRLAVFLCAVQAGETDRARQIQLAAALRKNIVVSDSTLSRLKESPELFDIVATNPPYISYGSRGQLKLADGHGALLRSLYPHSSEYKIRLHSIFQDICLRYAKPGADVLMLLPDAFLTGSFYKKLRGLVTDQSEIVQIAELPHDTIPDATVGNWCIAHYRKKTSQAPQQKDVAVAIVDACGFAQKSLNVPFSVFVSRDRLRFNVLTNHLDLNLIEHLSGFPALGEGLRGHTGIRSRNGQQSIIADCKVADQYKPGLVSGAQVLPFNSQWQGHWLNLKKGLLFAGGFDPTIVERPKILIRQTADRIIAAADDQSLYHLNNIHSFVPVGNGLRLDAYAAVLNSKLFSYVYRLRSRETSKALAQIDIDMVETMPFPSPDCHADILNLAGRLLRNAAQDAGARRQLTRAVDRLIYDLYAVPAEIVAHIDDEQLPASSQARELILSVETKADALYN